MKCVECAVLFVYFSLLYSLLCCGGKDQYVFAKEDHVAVKEIVLAQCFTYLFPESIFSVVEYAVAVHLV